MQVVSGIIHLSAHDVVGEVLLLTFYLSVSALAIFCESTGGAVAGRLFDRTVGTDHITQPPFRLTNQ